MSPFTAELVGTALLLLLGDGVVANVVLKDTKGSDSGWIVITGGWGLAVFVAVFCVAAFSGAHINPAVTVGLATAGAFPWASVPSYLAAQFIGAALGAFLVWVQYYAHFGATEDRDAKLAAFCTGPAIRSSGLNFISEVIGTFVLVFGVLYMVAPAVAGPGGVTGGLGAIDALPVGLLVLVIGLALGGTTGYAINPARDLSPRIVHALVPMPGGKRDSDWSYAWIPVLGPVAGGVLAGVAYLMLGA
ncbi:MAG: aquaporin family protein [Gemmatimonadota bacterium]|nr:aquaporin family protein [Gemmatimonadota bacterium]MDH3421712.1 aquaporin family protein [Gemmatimonadota bacterium]